MNGLAEKMKYWNPYLGGALLGLLLFLSFFVTSHGLGASGGVHRIAVAIEDDGGALMYKNRFHVCRHIGCQLKG